MRSLLALTAALAAAAPARAADVRIAVVALDAPPDLTYMGKSTAEAFAKAARKAGGFEVMEPAKVEAALGRDATVALVRCGDDAKCLADRSQKLGVERVVGGWLRRKGETYRVALVQADARSGERIAGMEREIPVASRRLQKDVAAAAPALLAGEKDATGILRVVTDVPGAAVKIDDADAGTTPVVRVVKPGKHKVAVAGIGFQDAAPIWVEVPANGIVEHRPRLYQIPARDRPNQSATEGSGTKVQVTK
ncbi:MAG TPA: PEGA domain-containing protein [Anaeromyxobacter sp.]|nr:PEGA domain-containing protein [Anaeromyxobacter sp.]